MTGGAALNLQYISEAYIRRKLSHAYILEGSPETGIEAFADQLGAALLCDQNRRMEGMPLENAEGFLLTPCGKCPSCIKARSGNHPDLIPVRHEKETVLSVQEIRDQIVSDISIKPYYGPYKIYIVRDAQLMNENAQNALLKTIEEPAEYGVILLLTDNADGFLPTIRSRCICLRMGTIPKQETVQKVMEGEGASVLDVIHSISSMDAVKINKAAKEMEAGDRKQILWAMQLYVRDLLVQKSTGDRERLYFQDDFRHIEMLAKKLSYEQMQNLQQALDDASARLAASVKAEAVFETLLLAMRKQLA